MGIRRVVNTDFWKDDVVAEQYSAEDRYFMLYLLTNPNTKQCGIYHLPIRTMSFELGYTQDATKSIIERFENKFKNIIYSKKTNEIAILNFLKHSIIKGGKPVEDCIRKELGQVKDKQLITEVYKHLLNFMNEQIEYKEKSNGTSMYVGIKKVFNEFINEDDINNDNDNDNERIVVRIVDESSKQSIFNKELEKEFEKLWKEYPNKKGKDSALKIYKKVRKEGTAFEEVQQGIINYKKEISIKKTEKKYIKHGSTWFNQKCWGDDYETKEDKPVKTERRVF